ncbi:DUF1622 domain-containing protein [Streptomyces sp. NPDC057555]|uniref:DUF1622 domain-containing protein n=1 Tax=Streptomyces sp. NPDC057555 TaxID=3346166 RepID=UPI00369636A6
MRWCWSWASWCPWGLPLGPGGGLGYLTIRRCFGGALLLGLEVLAAADLIRTVAVAPTLDNVRCTGPARVDPDLPQLLIGGRARGGRAVAPSAGQRCWKRPASRHTGSRNQPPPPASG